MTASDELIKALFGMGDTFTPYVYHPDAAGIIRAMVPKMLREAFTEGARFQLDINLGAVGESWSEYIATNALRRFPEEP